MVLVRRIRSRGANIVVEANAEVLFAPGGQIGRWQNRFSNRVTAFARQEAPTNKRPRWAHYGKPLKTTITSSTTYQPGRLRVYSAVGSTAPHAYYVDQGTGVFNGGSPYRAKVIPPWTRNSPSLYEATWRPAGPGTRQVRPVYIKGQKGQKFFEKGLERGMRAMRLRGYQKPTEPRIAASMASVTSGMDNFRGNTPADGAFIASLEEWRGWRDEAWTRHETLGKGGGKPTNRGKTPAGSKAPTKPTKPKSPPKQAGPSKADLRKDKQRAIAKANAKYGASNVESVERSDDGRFWEFTIKYKDSEGRNRFKIVKLPVRA